MPAGRGAVAAHQQQHPGAVLLATMVGWWDGKTYSGSGNWLNKGTAGSAGDLVLGPSTATPSFANSTFSFDGVNDTAQTAGDVAAFDPTAKGTNFTVGVVLQFPGTITSIGSVLSQAGSSSRPGFVLASSNAATGAAFAFIADASLQPQIAGTTALGASTWGLLTIGCTSANQVFSKTNNSAANTTTDTRTASSATTGRTTRAGQNQAGGTYQKFDTRCMFIHQGALTAQNLTDIGSYYSLTI